MVSHKDPTPVLSGRAGKGSALFAVAAAILAVSCAGPASHTHVSEATGPGWKGAAIVIDETKLASDQAAACARAQALLVPPDAYGQAAEDAGMLPDDFESLRRTIDRLDVSVSFRDSNQACAPHLRAGMESKGHDVLTKTFIKESLAKEYEYLAGTVSTLSAKPKPGEILSDPLAKRYLTKDGRPLTCDYDMMDMLVADGVRDARIPGESARDLSVREALNSALPLRGDPPHRVDRIKHGAQAAYPDYLRTLERLGEHEQVITDLFKPEHPLTMIDKDGKVYRWHDVEDALNYYRCVGAGTPPEWNLQRSSR